MLPELEEPSGAFHNRSEVLARLTAGWAKRVTVKKPELELDELFVPTRADFPERLVPLLALDELQSIDPEAKRQILAASWIAYNAKTFAIENEIILPACRLMLEERIPTRKDTVSTTALHQTIIDEHFHILMCEAAAAVARRRRNLEHLSFDPRGWSVIQYASGYCEGLNDNALNLARIAFAVAAESTINAFLSTIAADKTIQPMNQVTVDLHRLDERGHAVVFREIVRTLYWDLDPEERKGFASALAHGLVALKSPDLAPWVQIASAGGVRIEDEDTVLGAFARAALPRDYSPLRALLEELDLTGMVLPSVLEGG
jgi:alpha-N-dichloroacetyl-p-aminophenylserinol N-oxygenase